MRVGITAEGLPHAILTAQACCGVAWQARRRFPIPSAAATTAATNNAACSHSRRVRAHAIPAPAPACHTALSGDKPWRTCGWPCRAVPVAPLGGSRPSSGPVRSPPLAYRSGVSSASAPAAASQAPCVPVRTPPISMSPVWQPPPASERLPQRRARTVATVPSERGLCAWVHAPARTSAVSIGCRQTAPGQHQCKLPRQLNAEILARAFAPRRATSGLVRIPPASVANGGESRSLGKRITPQNVRLYSLARAAISYRASALKKRSGRRQGGLGFFSR